MLLPRHSDEGEEQGLSHKEAAGFSSRCLKHHLCTFAFSAPDSALVLLPTAAGRFTHFTVKFISVSDNHGITWWDITPLQQQRKDPSFKDLMGSNVNTASMWGCRQWQFPVSRRPEKRGCDPQHRYDATKWVISGHHTVSAADSGFLLALPGHVSQVPHHSPLSLSRTHSHKAIVWKF